MARTARSCSAGSARREPDRGRRCILPGAPGRRAESPGRALLPAPPDHGGRACRMGRGPRQPVHHARGRPCAHHACQRAGADAHPPRRRHDGHPGSPPRAGPRHAMGRPGRRGGAGDRGGGAGPVGPGWPTRRGAGGPAAITAAGPARARLCQRQGPLHAGTDPRSAGGGSCPGLRRLQDRLAPLRSRRGARHPVPGSGARRGRRNGFDGRCRASLVVRHCEDASGAVRSVPAGLDRGTARPRRPGRAGGATPVGSGTHCSRRGGNAGCAALWR